MALSISVTRAFTAVAPASIQQRRILVRVQAKKDTGPSKDTGYVTTDNSGRGNIFPTTSKPFYKSPTSEAVANQGLGGLQGIAVLGGALALVGLATAGLVNKESAEALQKAAELTYSGEALTDIAARIQASL